MLRKRNVPLRPVTDGLISASPYGMMCSELCEMGHDKADASGSACWSPPFQALCLLHHDRHAVPPRRLLPDIATDWCAGCQHLGGAGSDWDNESVATLQPVDRNRRPDTNIPKAGNPTSAGASRLLHSNSQLRTHVAWRHRRRIASLCTGQCTTASARRDGDGVRRRGIGRCQWQCFRH